MAFNYRYTFRGKSPDLTESRKKGPEGPRPWMITVGIAIAVALVLLGIVKLVLVVSGGTVRSASATAAQGGKEENKAPAASKKEAKKTPASDSKQKTLTGEAKQGKAVAPNPEAEALCVKAEEAFAAEKYNDAIELALKAIASVTEEDALWDRAALVLGKANIALFSSDLRAPEKELYSVKKGDALALIANEFNTTIEAIQKGNGMAETDSTIHPGQTLCIYKGDWKIRVSKSKCKLYLYNGKKLFKVYMVGIGKQDRTPEGTFEINVKQKEPDWYSKGVKYPYGSKENVLGTRWLAIKPTGDTDQNLKGFGIHGTWESGSVGKSTSNGCVRLENSDVEELFTIVPLHTELLIED
ncbi:MAG: hypothetical protein A2X49_14020 [Lentisphaerae bacterium GWF2_52_8]|nr:MAG: hypothetical protein A2X49_14020 [Lentisphaerae bacterium GWF2_52_8]